MCVFFTLEDGARAPERATGDSAGYDLFSSADATVRPGETVLVPTGVRIAMPPGMEAQVRPRSGLSLRTPLRIANAPGTIDADYRDAISVIAENTFPLTDPLPALMKKAGEVGTFADEYSLISFREYFERAAGCALPDGVPDTGIFVDRDGNPFGTLTIRKGERIAQLVFSRPVFPECRQVTSLEGIGTDRGGGFGSTGV